MLSALYNVQGRLFNLPSTDRSAWNKPLYLSGIVALLGAWASMTGALLASELFNRAGTDRAHGQAIAATLPGQSFL
ncbi:hypothetical protein AD952_13270 [Acetobacter cerevisiae]|nr:hypothetical protein AD928_01295 [Acetobacter cerevisiae]KXV70302.1 hypothetical protein AD952_13270 [Acetobacter cerevisiae]KXV79586.1 hypothetical protein AD953_01690 [Acetobacter malorum]GBQ10172.1 hypothetical protein AA14362_2475 [Acetobacter cerevisiae DSM 14362]